MRPHPANYGIDRFLPWKQWRMIFREHLISSQFFSKRNAFQIGFTPSLPPLSERLIAHFLAIIDVVLPQDLIYPRRNCSDESTLVLPLKRSFSRHHHLHFFLVSPFPVPLHASSVLRLATRLASTRSRPGLQATSWWGHARPCPCPGALCEGWTASPTVDLRGQLIYRAGVWAVTEPDACTRSELRNQYSFCVENVRFVIFHPKLALPPSPRFEMRYVYKITANLRDAPLQLFDYSKSFLVHWQCFPGCLSVLTNSFPSHHTFRIFYDFPQFWWQLTFWSATP